MRDFNGVLNDVGLITGPDSEMLLDAVFARWDSLDAHQRKVFLARVVDKENVDSNERLRQTVNEMVAEVSDLVGAISATEPVFYNRLGEQMISVIAEFSAMLKKTTDPTAT